MIAFMSEFTKYKFFFVEMNLEQLLLLVLIPIISMLQQCQAVLFGDALLHDIHLSLKRSFFTENYRFIYLSNVKIRHCCCIISIMQIVLMQPIGQAFKYQSAQNKYF